jgi:hypothetical protein
MSKLSPEEKMTWLCKQFPTLRQIRGVDPWGPDRFDQSTYRKTSSGLRHAAAFILSLWDFYRRRSDAHGNGDESGEPPPRKIGRFDAVHAMRSWDKDHRRAFANWVSDPWWP